jgi:hypothetical protein
MYNNMTTILMIDKKIANEKRNQVIYSATRRRFQAKYLWISRIFGGEFRCVRLSSILILF